MYAIVDCNNFYASCERLFKPGLIKAPIVVLSNNDGCVIARSNEAKALGIKMGEPYFKVQPLIKRHAVQVFSSNYALYGDMSNRVMEVLESSWPEIEIYSIDEAFMCLSTLASSQQTDFCVQLASRVQQYTGIPVSIGIGPTKTLAKLANFVTKKALKIPVFNITNERHWLKDIPVGDVWGIGRQWNEKLGRLGINTAYDLSVVEPRTFKRKFNVVLERTILELQGIHCVTLDSSKAKKEIISSKSFGQLQTDYESIAQALSSYVAKATTKLRQQQSQACYLSVFIRGNPFREDLPYYSKSTGFRLINPSDDVRVLTRYAKQCLQQIYQKGYHYKKTGVVLGELIDKSQRQLNLFDGVSNEEVAQSEQLMDVLNKINARFGRHAIHLASEGVGQKQSWRMKAMHQSPHYTTSWDDLPIVYAH